MVCVVSGTVFGGSAAFRFVMRRLSRPNTPITMPTRLSGTWIEPSRPRYCSVPDSYVPSSTPKAFSICATVPEATMLRLAASTLSTVSPELVTKPVTASRSSGDAPYFAAKSPDESRPRCVGGVRRKYSKSGTGSPSGRRRRTIVTVSRSSGSAGPTSCVSGVGRRSLPGSST